MTITSLAGAQAPAAGPVITEPGVYEMTNEEYHRDPVPGGSLSSSGARKLLAPGCPARFRHDQLNGQASNEAFDFGHAAHLMVLGEGADLYVVDADGWTTKAARAERDEARAGGLVPILQHQYQQVQAMAAAIRRHPIAGGMFNHLYGSPEQSLFWQDVPTGVWRRARLDWLPDETDGRMIVADYKTTISADPESISRSVHNYGYHQQAAWYLDAVRALDLANSSAVMVFVFQEKTPPYLVNVVQLDQAAMRIGRERNRRAIAAYQACIESGRWPGYSDRIEIVTLPAWAEKQESL
ncbi:PD-(D/E)XK nuclease-like domain-containing protein [Kitasatospora indigofera]|uniref:PD-(D/E)XK nuclease-like domain-containing protein n=1 Tax=Kitasatospora indigofera TaxID=67307 RepID=UPI00369558B4